MLHLVILGGHGAGKGSGSAPGSMLQFYLPNKTVKFRVTGVEPRASQKKPKMLPYLLRAIMFDESLPRTHLSGFLYSSITFAFLLVIVSFGTLVHETNWKIFFKTIFF